MTKKYRYRLKTEAITPELVYHEAIIHKGVYKGEDEASQIVITVSGSFENAPEVCELIAKASVDCLNGQKKPE